MIDDVNVVELSAALEAGRDLQSALVACTESVASRDVAGPPENVS